MINDVSRALSSWAQALTGTRKSGSYVSGRWIEGTETSLSFYGVVQNANPLDLKVLPEGNRTDEAIKIHTTTQLIPETDFINYNGSTYKIVNVANRAIGNYYKALGLKE